MDASQIQLVQSSLWSVAPSDHLVNDLVAKELDDIADDFSGDDLVRERQQRALAAITSALHTLHAPERIPALRRTWDRAPIRQIDFDCAGNALLRALKRALGAQFTPDLWRAWVAALCAVAQLLTEPCVMARELEPA